MKPTGCIMTPIMTAILVAAVVTCARTLDSPSAPKHAAATGIDGVAAFETVRAVLQHPRCQNCHIPGDAPLQFDDSRPHAQNVTRGPRGDGVPGFACSTCHATHNSPAIYGTRAPPGAPNWRLPPPETKMVFIGLSSHDLAAQLKDPRQTNGKDLAALLEHVSHDALVLWGWHPGGDRAPVSVPHEEFVQKFSEWIAAGAPVPPVSAAALPAGAAAPRVRAAVQATR